MIDFILGQFLLDFLLLRYISPEKRLMLDDTKTIKFENVLEIAIKEITFNQKNLPNIRIKFFGIFID